MMIESECNNGGHGARNSPMNGRQGILHHRNHLLTTGQCVISVDSVGNASSGKRISICMGCGQEIYDQYILRVAPDLEWHAHCLKCADCKQFLDETCTCFVKDGKTYCRQDYARQFGVKCAKCNQLFRKNDYVMRARNKIYHIDCFRCIACLRPLLPGDEFALREDGLFCKADHESMTEKCLSTTALTKTSNEATITAICNQSAGIDIVDSRMRTSELDMLEGDPMGTYSINDNGLTPPLGVLQVTRSIPTPLGIGNVAQQPNLLPTVTGSSQSHHRSPFLKRQRSSSCSSQDSFGGDDRSNSGHGGGDQASTTSASGGGPPSTSGTKKDKKDKPKTTRVRTVLNEKQLHTLRSCYNANPRPDALMKEQLVEMTGLSPRVIRVWFQNKRCKDKKKQILMKQIQQQQEKNQALSGIRLQGVGPLIAASPTRHDMPMVQPLDVHQYQQNSALWVSAQAMAASVSDYHHHHGPPMLSEHALHALESHHQTPFQQLMHGFGDPRSVETSVLSGCYVPPNAAGFGPPGSQQMQVGGIVGVGGLDPADLGSLSPHLAPSDLSSPSCSE